MQKIIDQTVKSGKTLRVVVMEVENDSTTVENQVEIPQVQCPLLSPKPTIRYVGDKIEFIRILLSLCLLGRFEDNDGTRQPDYKVFQFFGECLGMNLSNYLKALDRTKQEGTSMETQTRIFKEMEEAIRKYFEEE